MHCFSQLLSLGGLQGGLQGHDACLMCCAVGVKVSNACFYQRHIWKLLGTNNNTCQKVYTLWSRTKCPQHMLLATACSCGRAPSGQSVGRRARLTCLSESDLQSSIGSIGSCQHVVHLMELCLATHQLCTLAGKLT